MVTLTMKCSRCSKEVSHDVTNQSFNNEYVRKFGFHYIHDGKTNILICDNCEKSYIELKTKLEHTTKQELCSFFNNYDKGKGNGSKRGSHNE